MDGICYHGVVPSQGGAHGFGDYLHNYYTTTIGRLIGRVGLILVVARLVMGIVVVVDVLLVAGLVVGIVVVVEVLVMAGLVVRRWMLWRCWWVGR